MRQQIPPGRVALRFVRIRQLPASTSGDSEHDLLANIAWLRIPLHAPIRQRPQVPQITEIEQ